MGGAYSCSAPAPSLSNEQPPARCGRPVDHRGVHVAYGPKGREVDTWPRFEDVVRLKRDAGTL